MRSIGDFGIFRKRTILYDGLVKTLVSLFYSKRANLLLGILLATCWTYFAYRQLHAFEISGSYLFLVFCLSETIQAVFFLFRNIPKTVSTELFDWMVAFGGTFTVLFFVPGGDVIWEGASVLVYIGASAQIAGLISLNRSFAIIPANRQIKTLGLYRFVRHPIYSSYILVYSGYVLRNASIVNLSLLLLAITFLYLRIESEEKHLSSDENYVQYMKKVRFRLFPFVY